MKVTENFTIEEFVPKAVFQRLGANAIWVMDKRIILFAQYLRDTFGPITINDWSWGGQHDSRGFRPPDDPDGAKLSQHRFGRAIDPVFEHEDPEIIRKHIIDNFRQLNRDFGITTIEADTPSWVHVDARWTNSNEILIVPYK